MDKMPFEVLEEMLTEAARKVPVGSIWRHYKGNDYRVGSLVIREEDNQVAVIYTPLKHPETSFVRSLTEWLEKFEWHKETVQRFTLLR